MGRHPIFLVNEDSRRQARRVGASLGEDRAATKAYLKLFIEKIVINLPRIDITCKSECTVGGAGK